MASPEKTEPFPSLPRSPVAKLPPGSPTAVSNPDETKAVPTNLNRTASNTSGPSRPKRTSSLAQSFLSSNPPFGICQATGEVASKIPTLAEIKKGSFGADGWTEEGQLEQRGESPHQIQKRRTSRASSLSASRRRRSTTSPLSTRADEGEYFYSPVIEGAISDDANRVPPTIPEAPAVETHTNDNERDPTIPMEQSRPFPSANPEPTIGPDETGTYPNGYRFPPKHTWGQSTAIGLAAFWKFFLTPFGFLITIYGLNVVAWGAMLFFVLLKAAPAMCHPSCSDPNSARQIWIEIDSQILNGLFCVTGFGLIPWRFRDLYYLVQWRLFKKHDYFRRLAGHNRGWFRLPGSDKLDVYLVPPPLYSKKNPKQDDSPMEWSDEEIAQLEKDLAIPLPATSMPPRPLTGIRARPTKPILIDVVVWMYILNTVFQACLAGCMWGLTRFTRPSWVTGFLITIGCVVAMIAGLVVFLEGKKIKKIEGIPVEEAEVESDVEKAPNTAISGQNANSDEKLNREKVAVSVHNQALANGNNHENRPGLPRSKTEKIKGKHWYERH